MKAIGFQFQKYFNQCRNQRNSNIWFFSANVPIVSLKVHVNLKNIFSYL
jgi:hypothetical protein